VRAVIRYNHSNLLCQMMSHLRVLLYGSILSSLLFSHCRYALLSLLSIHDLVKLLLLQEQLRSVSMSMSVCGSICLSVREDISGTTRAIFTIFSFFPMSLARSSSGVFTIGRITCRREGVFFPIENALLAGKVGGNAQSRRNMLSTVALFCFSFSCYAIIYGE